jgi:hypothetical protein
MLPRLRRAASDDDAEPGDDPQPLSPEAATVRALGRLVHQLRAENALDEEWPPEAVDDYDYGWTRRSLVSSRSGWFSSAAAASAPPVPQSVREALVLSPVLRPRD